MFEKTKYLFITDQDLTKFSLKDRKMIKMKFSIFFKLSSRKFATQMFVPKHSPASENDIQETLKFLSGKQNLLVLTGAGKLS